MNHAGEGLLQAYVDGEVTGEAKASLAAHIATCGECGRELEELRRAAAVFSGAMSLFSESSSVDTVALAREQVLRAHRATADTTPKTSDATDRTTVLTPRFGFATSTNGRSFGRFATGSLARAAALVLLLAGGAAAMIPGSPLRRWISERIAAVFAPRTAVTTPAVPAPSTTVTPREMVPGAEMSIAPVNGRVTIHLFADNGDGTLTVRMVDADRATVQADSSARSVAFRTAPGSMEVLNLGTADAAIQIPRTVRALQIDVNGRHFLIKDTDSLRVTGPVVRRTETEIVFKTGS